VHQIRVSPSGDKVAFQEIVLGKSALSVVDRNKQKRVVVGDLPELNGLAWTADGSGIWFAGKTDRDGWGLFAATLSGDVRLLLRFPGPLELEDVADGRALINRYSSQTGIRYLPPGAEREKDMSWLDWSFLADLASDGQWLLFAEFGEGAGSQGAVYLRRGDGSPAVRLGTGLAQSLSQDGKWALSMSRSRHELNLLPTGVGEARTITLPDGFERFQGAQWLPDGRLLVEALERGKDPKVYVLKQGSALRPISEAGLLSVPVVSPDGLRALVWLNQKAVILDVNGAAAQAMPGVEPGEVPVAWTSDGQSALVSSERDSATTVTRVNLKTGARTPWKVLTPADPAGLVRLFNLRVSADGKSYAYSYTRQLGELYVVEGLR
jgi:eukaryotic-like serine/threonine-protein kinase